MVISHQVERVQFFFVGSEFDLYHLWTKHLDPQLPVFIVYFLML